MKIINVALLELTQYCPHFRDQVRNDSHAGIVIGALVAVT